MATDNRVPVMVDRSVYDRLKEYSEKTGVPMKHAVNEAIDDFVETVVPARLEAFDKPRPRLELVSSLTPAQA